jgi:hypothetical protein
VNTESGIPTIWLTGGGGTLANAGIAYASVKTNATITLNNARFIRFNSSFL